MDLEKSPHPFRTASSMGHLNCKGPQVLGVTWPYGFSISTQGCSLNFRILGGQLSFRLVSRQGSMSVGFSSPAIVTLHLSLPHEEPQESSPSGRPLRIVWALDPWACGLFAMSRETLVSP